MCMLTEIFVPCFFGSMALAQSNLIMRRIYESNWIEQDSKYKQALCIFVTRSSQPIHLCVEKVFLLDLHTFLKVKLSKKRHYFKENEFKYKSNYI